MEEKSTLNSLVYQLEQARPRRLLIMAPSTPPNISAWLKQNACELVAIHNPTDFQSLNTRFDFTIVIGYLECLDKSLGLTQLGKLRNLLSTKIWVQIDHGSGWLMNDFLALGFKRLAQFEGDGVKTADCYGYDLATYNHKRSWNNAKYWANPENWNKNRW